MEIKFEITRKDYWNLAKDSFIHVPILRYILIGFSLVFSYLFIMPILHNPKLAIGYIVFDCIFILIFYNVMKWMTIIVPSKKAGVLGEHIITINSEGISDSTKVKRSTTKWDGVLRIVSNKKYIYIFIDNIAAHLIPRRAFYSNEDANRFFSSAKEFWMNNK